MPTEKQGIVPNPDSDFSDIYFTGMNSGPTSKKVRTLDGSRSVIELVGLPIRKLKFIIIYIYIIAVNVLACFSDVAKRSKNSGVSSQKEGRYRIEQFLAHIVE